MDKRKKGYRLKKYVQYICAECGEVKDNKHPVQACPVCGCVFTKIRINEVWRPDRRQVSNANQRVEPQ